MDKQRVFRRNLIAAAAALALFGGSGFARADDSIATALVLEPDSTGSVTVDGVIGVEFGMPVLDVDFYSFAAKAGQKVTIDIDKGMSGSKELDTTLYLFGPNGMQLPLPWGFNDDGGVQDEGSPAPFGGQDARIEGFDIPADGIYTFAVTDVSVSVNPDGSYSPNQLGINSGYTVVVSGLTASAPPGPDPVPEPTPDPVVQTNIEIKAGAWGRGSQREIMVALLSSRTFDPRDVDVDTLSFAVGDGEADLRKCSKHGWRVNRDHRRDLLCHFTTEVSGSGKVDAVLRGKLKDGKAFEGRGSLKMVRAKDRDRRHDHDDDDRRRHDHDGDRHHHDDDNRRHHDDDDRRRGRRDRD